MTAEATGLWRALCVTAEAHCGPWLVKAFPAMVQALCWIPACPGLCLQGWPAAGSGAVTGFMCDNGPWPVSGSWPVEVVTLDSWGNTARVDKAG